MSELKPNTEEKYVFLISAIVCIAWSYIAGKDLNWDQLNYHLYAADSFWNNRLQQDFFPASIQSYLNPFSYIPFYLMVLNNWPDLLIGSVLALFHSVNFYLLYLICRKIWPTANGTLSKDGIFALLLGAASPIFWQEIGSSFNDIAITSLVLLSIYFAIYCRTVSAAILIGLLLGTATGLKLTFGVYGVAILPLLVTGKLSTTCKQVWAYGLAGLSAITLVHGWWSWQLWTAFKNPLFPFFNGYFKSPYFLPESLSLTRFIPKDIGTALFLPFEMIQPVSWIHTEAMAPDLRPAAILVLAGILGFVLLRKVAFPHRFKILAKESEIKLIAFSAVGIILWMITSANGRYGLPIALLSGVIIISLTRIIFHEHSSRFMFLAIFLLLHTGHVVVNSSGRWNPYKWEGIWFDLDISPELKHTPALYLSISNQPHAYLASWLHPKSSIVNLIGQYVQPSTGVSRQKLNNLIQTQQGRIFVAYESNLPISLENARLKTSIGANLQLYGLGFTSGDCHQIRLNSAGKYPMVKKSEEGNYVSFCPVSTIDSLINTKDLLAAKQIKLAIEEACPEVFKPKGVELSKMRDGYSAFYVGTEYFLNFNNAGDVYGTQVHASTDFSLGNYTDWLGSKKTESACPTRKRALAWFSPSWQN
jgi:hypothetical protein